MTKATKAIRELKSTIKFNVWKLDLAIKTLKKHANEDYREVREVLKKERDENDEAFKSNKLVPELQEEAVHQIYRIDTTLNLLEDITIDCDIEIPDEAEYPTVAGAIKVLRERQVNALIELARLEAK